MDSSFFKKDESSGSWSSWANLLIKETQRFSDEIKHIQDEMKDTSKEILQLQKDIITINSSKLEEELLKKDIVTIRSNMGDIKKDIESLKVETADQKRFKERAMTGFTIFNFIVFAGVGILTAIGQLSG